MQLAFTEWEEIIALSRAFAPGGKLLGLSSTKKIIATLHHRPAKEGGGSGNDEGHQYGGAFELSVWELHRADRGLLNSKNSGGGAPTLPASSKHSGPATPKFENSARAFYSLFDLELAGECKNH